MTVLFPFRSVLSVALWSGIAAVSFASEIEDKAVEILTQRCHQCHGVEFKYETLNVLDREVLTGTVRVEEGELPYVTPGKPDESRLWEVVADGYMPPKGGLPDDEREVLKEWIEKGAAWPVDFEREFIPEIEILKKIANHLFQVRKDDRRFQRYLTLTHIHNNRNVTRRDLLLYRAALSKAVNGMSRVSSIVVPKALDEEQTIFNIDLRHYGWQEFGTWDAVLEEYPYGLKPQSSIEALELYEKIEELYGNTNFDGITHLRADWFIANATRPPLYHVLVDIPETLDDLLSRVNVSIEDNFRLGISRRAGLFESGVSGQNRLIEYHSSSNGTFWISYDFQADSPRSNLARFPLGPKFEGNEFDNVAFVHAGGEMIFNLPNGLHGYMLTDGEGNRIDSGPVEIVWDSLNVSGSPLIVNGLSCISCHKHGMIPLSDFIRTGNAMQDPAARRKVQELYADKSELDSALSQSKDAYLQKLMEAIGGPLGIDKNDFVALQQFEEPVSRVTKLYSKNIDLEAAARELGFEDVDLLKNQVFSGRLVELGLGPLAIEEGTIKRAFWDSKETTASVYQEAAAELRIGTPISN